MGKNIVLTIRDKKTIYLNDKPLIEESFDVVLNYQNYLIAFNSNLIFFIDPNGRILNSLNGNISVIQVFNSGEYISLKISTPTRNTMGVFRYNGEIVVPFEYDSVFLSDKGIEVRAINTPFTFYKRW